MPKGGRPSSTWSAKTGDVTKNNLVLGGDNRSYINQIHYAVSDSTAPPKFSECEG